MNCKRPLKSIGLLVTLGSLMLSCNHNTIKDIDEYKSTSSVLVYMAADNNLYYDAIDNLDQISEGLKNFFSKDDNASSQSILVYFNGITDSRFPTPCLIRLKSDGSQSIILDVLKEYPKQNSSDPETLRRVIDDAQSYNGSVNYIKGLVLWSHGTGWLPPAINFSVRSFGYDQGDLHLSVMEREMDIVEMSKVLKDYHFDFLMFDACLMASVEVCYQLKDVANYIIAAPTEILSTGCPYQLIIPYFFSKSSDYVKKIAESYYNYYNRQLGLFRSCAISVINTSYMEELAQFYSLLLDSNISKLDIKDSCNLYFKDKLQMLDVESSEYFFDMKHFVESYGEQNRLLFSQRKFDEIWGKVVIYEAHTPYFLNNKIDHCGGLSIYLPQSYFVRKAIDEYYSLLDWSITVNK